MATIVRGPNAASHFTIISNAALRDERLSWKARGLLAYLMSMDTGWVTSVERLSNVAPDGSAAVKTGLVELENCGYLVRRQTRGQDAKGGTFSNTEYHVSDDPSTVGRFSTDGESTPDDTVGRFSASGSSASGESGTKKTSPKKNSTPEDSNSSAARSAATAPPVETSSSSNSPVTREDAAAAGDHVDAPRDARGRQRMHPADILDGMMLNPDEAGRFRTWLVDATGATNPDGLIVTLHGSGQLSERLSQWRASESTTGGYGAVQAPAAPRPGRLEWCGRCDQHTRMLTGHDQDGTEYLRRCPVCHVMAGIESPGAGAHHVIAMQAEQAARATGAGRAAFQAARAALPAGTPRRDTTIGTTIDPTTARKMAESEHRA